MPDENAIVEVVAADGNVKVPLGIVSVKQALEMPAEVGLEFSHPEHEAGETECRLAVNREIASLVFAFRT